MCFKDYYAVLEINYPSDEKEIKAAYRRLSVKWHPDKNPGVDTSNLMIDINEAYYILKNPESKDRYDSEYIRYASFKAANIKQADNEDQSYSDRYTPHDNNVWQDINEAHEKASELVDEFFASLKKVSKDATKGAWEEIYPYLIAGIVFLLISLIARSC